MDNLFSQWFEDHLLKQLSKLFERFIEINEQNKLQGFIRRENALKYYDGISEGTLRTYEKLGLKRFEPVENGYIYYSVEELNRFMFEHESGK
ncbi:hypothetical protein [Enterococcus avium]|uniref:hypothetical protein n=1 Tax=Enterococcus avium TaxID=33945 RepID=UPI003DA3E082